jgi:hypothetical protein
VMTTSKKLLDSSIFTDEKNSNIEDWLSIMRNKLKTNANWFSIETSKKVYVRIRIDEDAMKHLSVRFKKNFIKSFLIAEKIFDDLSCVFDDFNKRVNALKAYRRLKQIESNKEFHIFWTEFQRLTSDSKLYDEEILLKDLKNKMFWNLQIILASNIYKTIDLYEFVKFCQYTDQTLRDVKSKFRNTNREEYEESISKDNLNNQKSNREQSNASRFRSEKLKSQKSNNREMSKTLDFDQVNAFIYYNCDKSDHMTRNCIVFKKMNSKNDVKDIKKCVDKGFINQVGWW